MRKIKLPTLERKAGRPSFKDQYNYVINQRIIELDDDITALKRRRDLGYVSPAQARQLNRLIKLFEASIQTLEGELL